MNEGAAWYFVLFGSCLLFLVYLVGTAPEEKAFDLQTHLISDLDELCVNDKLKFMYEVENFCRNKTTILKDVKGGQYGDVINFCNVTRPKVNVSICFDFDEGQRNKEFLAHTHKIRDNIIIFVGCGILVYAMSIIIYCFYGCVVSVKQSMKKSTQLASNNENKDAPYMNYDYGTISFP